jgi:hypothetical protein
VWLLAGFEMVAGFSHTRLTQSLCCESILRVHPFKLAGFAMSDILKHGTFAGLTRRQAFCGAVLPACIVITIVVSFGLGYAGWNEIGAPGMIEGIVFGLVFGAVCILTLGIGIFVAENKRRGKLFGSIASAVVITAYILGKASTAFVIFYFALKGILICYRAWISNAAA